ncbi:MAG: helix-turn-helix domain-containing protein [Candidatus Gastranaerophilales bacterium]|nr:helix-turn-helix domain-containing protein [Candidatus Gastranaerophilales bacterium]
MTYSKAEIGENIKRNRAIRGITQCQLAEKVGLTEKQISKIETGIHYPKFENFIKILDALHLSMKEFAMCSVPQQTPALKSLLNIIYSLDEEEVKCYLSIFRNIEKMKSKKEL